MEGTPESAEILLERVDRRLAEIGKSRYWLANAASEGKAKGFLTDVARRGFLPKEPRLNRMAELLGVSVDWLMGRTSDPAPVRSEVSFGSQAAGGDRAPGTSDRRLDWNAFPSGQPGLPLVGTGDCGDLELCDESGNMVAIERNSFDPDYTVRILARPPALRGAHEAYAIEFRGDSMWPRFEPGEIGIVEPRRPYGRGDYVLVQLRGEESDEVVSVLVKRLVRESADNLVLQQFNPELTFNLPKSRVARVHPVRRPTDYLF